MKKPAQVIKLQPHSGMYLLDLFMHEFFEYPDGLIHSDNGCFSATLQKERRLMVKAMHSQKSPKMN